MIGGRRIETAALLVAWVAACGPAPHEGGVGRDGAAATNYGVIPGSAGDSTSGSGASGSESESELGGQVVRQSSEEALASDIAATAEALGIPAEELLESMRFQEAFHNKVSPIMAQHQDRVAALWVEPAPAKEGHIVFVGNPPAAAAELQSDPNIIVGSGAELSMRVQHSRVPMFAEALQRIGQPWLTVGYVQQTQRISVEYVPTDEPFEKNVLRAEVEQVFEEQSAEQREIFPDFDLVAPM